MEHEHKTPVIKAWIRDRILFLALLIFILGAFGYIAAAKFFDPASMWAHPIKEFALLVSMIGVVSLGYELFLRELTFNEYKDALRAIVNPDSVRLGVQGIYKNRSELGRAYTFDQLFKNVKKEIFIGGTSLLSISTASREMIKEKILRGINVKLLLMSPDSQVVELITKQGGGKSTFLNEIKTSLMLFQKLQEEIDEISVSSKKGKFQVHTYDMIPSHSFISLDEGKSGGVIIADIGPYLGRSNPRPSMVVTNKKDGLYDYWMEMNGYMWQMSKPFLTEPKPTGFEVCTLVFASGAEIEHFDKEKEVWEPSTLCQIPDHWRGIKGSQWIWKKDFPSLEEARTGTKERFRQAFTIPDGAINRIKRAHLLIRAADVARVTVNGSSLNHDYGGSDYPDPFFIDIEKYLKKGENTVQFELVSFAHPKAASPEENRKGLIYRLDLEYLE